MPDVSVVRRMRDSAASLRSESGTETGRTTRKIGGPRDQTAGVGADLCIASRLSASRPTRCAGIRWRDVGWVPAILRQSHRSHARVHDVASQAIGTDRAAEVCGRQVVCSRLDPAGGAGHGRCGDRRDRPALAAVRCAGLEPASGVFHGPRRIALHAKRRRGDDRAASMRPVAYINRRIQVQKRIVWLVLRVRRQRFHPGQSSIERPLGADRHC